MASTSLKIETRQGFWAYTARPFMLGPIDGYAVFPVLLFLLHIRIWSLVVLLTYLVVSMFLDRHGYNLPVLIRLLRVRIGGRYVSRRAKIGHHLIWK